MKAINSISTLMQRAAMPPPADPSLPKKSVSVRVELATALSLESMARALGKSVSGLGAELMEAAVNDFSNNLGQLRPDLLRALTDDEERCEWMEAEQDGTQPDLLPRPTWLTPGAARMKLEMGLLQKQTEEEEQD